MATVQVVLDEDDVRRACEYWATRFVLNEGRAVSSDLVAIVRKDDPEGTINRCTVTVETKGTAATPRADRREG